MRFEDPNEILRDRKHSVSCLAEINLTISNRFIAGRARLAAPKLRFVNMQVFHLTFLSLSKRAAPNRSSFASRGNKNRRPIDWLTHHDFNCRNYPSSRTAIEFNSITRFWACAKWIHLNPSPIVMSLNQDYSRFDQSPHVSLPLDVEARNLKPRKKMIHAQIIARHIEFLLLFECDECCLINSLSPTTRCIPLY